MSAAELTQAVTRYVDGGGAVMAPLVACAVALWYVVGYRAALLLRGDARAADEQQRAALEARYRRGASLGRTIVAVAPLLGLLGTVSGMIEMFNSLGTSTFASQDGGIAGGIAEALFTTQLGLGVAIPGYFATRLLDRRATKLVARLQVTT